MGKTCLKGSGQNRSVLIARRGDIPSSSGSKRANHQGNGALLKLERTWGTVGQFHVGITVKTADDDAIGLLCSLCSPDADAGRDSLVSVPPLWVPLRTPSHHCRSSKLPQKNVVRIEVSDGRPTSFDDYG